MLQSYRAQWDDSALAKRWQALVPRERLAVSALLAFVLLVLLYVGLWQPTQQRVHTARNAFEAQRELNAYMHSQAPLLRNQASTPQTSIDPTRLQGLITSSAAAHGLSIERLDNDSAGAVQVNLQPAPFARLLQWIEHLQGQGVQISEAGLDRGADNAVAARLTLRAGDGEG
ncbi:type II secretion system protein M [Pseudomonas sp. 5P_3.1_Bac2]|uniref:type II secretion system protein M n=1 Tax=Pseudomonas sp. 5P_3.1_Bac2 TaxID=2971617 RepID=UPI0029055DE6|nr:type II secretion system protein M [Pseudomonas sp. 5P_3.1_Bac2]